MSTKKIDALYLQGKEQEDSFSFYHTNLRPFLMDYAKSIGRQTQKVIDVHLIDEMVDDLLMEISDFQGRSGFSTWVYVRFYRRWIAEYRSQRKHIGESLESMQDAEEGNPPSVAESDMDQTLIVNEFKSGLSERQLQVLAGRIEGDTFEQIATELDVTAARAHQIWSQVLERAQEYGLEGLKRG